MMKIRNPSRVWLFVLAPILTLNVAASHGASVQVADYRKAVSEIKKQYTVCKEQLNNQDARAKASCSAAQSMLARADRAYSTITNSERAQKPVPAIREVQEWYKTTISKTLAVLQTRTSGNQTVALAGGSSARLSADELPASAYENESSSADTALAGGSRARLAATEATQRRDSAVISFYAEAFQNDIMQMKRGELYNVFSFHRYLKRLQVDAFAAGDVQPGDELGYAAVCGQWVEWMLREEGINPLKIATFSWGHLDTNLAQFPRYFPAESGPSSGNAPYCVVGITADGSNAWNDESLGTVAIYISPQTSASESQVNSLVDELNEEPERLSVEIMGHADGPGTLDEIAQYGQSCADHITQTLTAAGVEPTRLETGSYGNAQLAYGNATSDRPWSCAVTVRDLLILE